MPSAMRHDQLPSLQPVHGRGWTVFGALALLDPDLATHAARSTALALALTDIGDDPAPPEWFWGFLLHDIGSLNVPVGILGKPGPLTTDERAVVAGHPIVGAELVASVPELEGAAPIVVHHHERWDGSGYPDRLRGEQIPLGARVLAVADTFCALTAPRPQRARYSLDHAIDIIEAEAGAQLDPGVVTCFLDIAPALPVRLLAAEPSGTWANDRLWPLASRARDLSRGQLEALFAMALGIAPSAAAERFGRSIGTQRNWVSSLRRSLACPPREPLPRFLALVGRRFYEAFSSA